MKRSKTDQKGQIEPGRSGFKNDCLASCQKILARIARVKESIFQESAKTLWAQEHLLRLVLNEAEAVAWRTMYPHLVFPALAVEKVQAVIAWDIKRQAVQRAKYAFWAASPARDRNHRLSPIEI
jgi:hypothetical protein